MAHKRKTHAEFLVKALGEHMRLNGNVIILFTQVDPDAVGSAMGLSEIITDIAGAQLNWNGTIILSYCGSVGHPQNNTLFNKYGLFEKFVPARDLNIGEDDIVMFVDSSSISDGRLPLELRGLDPVVVIDHHRGEDLPDVNDRFFWIEEVGAASTLVAELSQECGTQLSVSTINMMLLGIHTDTKDLTAASERDLSAYNMLKSQVDSSDELRSLINFSLPSSHFASLTHALNHKTRVANRVVANAGIIKPINGDVLSTIADDLLREEGVSLVIVWGFVGDCVRMSARSTDPSLSLNEFLKGRFDGNGGAKFAPDGRSEGGVLIPLGIFAGSSPDVLQTHMNAYSERVNELVLEE